jgi:hypothetical protein
MAVRVVSQEIPKGLDGNDGAGDCILLWDNSLEKDFQGVPCTSAQLREESAIIEEVSPEDFWHAKSVMAVRYGLKHFFTEPFPEFYHPFLMTRWTEMSALAREGKKVFMPAASALHTGEAIMEDAAIQVAIDNLPYVRAEEAVLPRKDLIVDLFQSLEVILHTLIVL